MNRPEEQRRFAHQTRTVTSPLHESGYGALVLERLAKQACRIAGVEWSCIFVRDRRDPRAVIAAAGHGLPWDLLGTRLGADEGSLARVLMQGEPAMVDDYGDLVGTHDGELRGCAAVALPIQWNGSVGGALSAASTTPGEAFGEEQLELLAELADLAAAALEHAHGGRHFDELMQAHVEALAAAMDMRDRRTARHSEDVVNLARAVGELLHLDGASLLELEFAARLHDVGKIRVPDAVLHKPGPLDQGEYEVIRCHAAWGAETLSGIPGLEAVAALVRFHHERWDGRGYPDGLSGARIPLASRIISACDAYAAMTADRPYRAAMPSHEALAEVLSGSGTQFDPAVVEALAHAVGGHG
ncbi:MAG TPA: HD-GYP domain-containing protein [Thermoleophilaceae bacterium]|nr:HD-GYP domain-containing protein [Thermoleophilaceae bacterium]